MSRTDLPGDARTRDEENAGVFERFGAADVRALIAEYPLAWVCARGGDRAEASLLPLVGVHDEAGELTELIGHLARSNPLHAALADDPRALILFRGPEAYVSPEYAGERDWAPTWNYAQLVIDAEIMFDAARTGEALDVLIEKMEDGRERPWRSHELGARYHGMLNAIIGFRARVTGLRGKFKLGQDERPEILDSILADLPDPAVRRWMRRFNQGRR